MGDGCQMPSEMTFSDAEDKSLGPPDHIFRLFVYRVFTGINIPGAAGQAFCSAVPETAKKLL